MLAALQLVIGVGIALLLPLLIYTGVATIMPPPKRSQTTNLQAETSEEVKRANREQVHRDQEEFRKALVKYAKLLFSVMAPAGLVAVIAGYLIGINSVGIGLLTGGILCLVYGYGTYWKHLPQPVRFVSILAGLTMLLFIGSRYTGIS